MKKMTMALILILSFILSGESVKGEWSSMGELLGVDGYVNKVLLKGDHIYFGGSFSSAGNVMAGNIARHNLKTKEWEALGGGVDGEVTAFAFDSKGELYVGGRFYNAGYMPAQNLAKWDGNSWSKIENCNFGKFEKINALAVDDQDRLIVAGVFSAFGSGYSQLDGLMMCDGQSAELIGDYQGYIGDLHFDAQGNLYAAGYCGATDGDPICGLGKWDGETWTLVGGKGFIRDELGMSINVITESDDGSIYVGGLFSKVGDIKAENIVMWNGTEWAALGNGIRAQDYGSGVRSIAIGDDGFVYAGGNIETVLASHMAKWGGHQWTSMPVGPSGTVTSIAIDKEKDELYIGGAMYSRVDAPSGLQQWTGEGWKDLGSIEKGLDSEINELAVDRAGDVLAVGNFSNAEGTEFGGLAKWKGNKWEHVVHSFVGSFHGITVDPEGRVIVGGAFYVEDSDEFNNIAAWDGKNWDSLGGGVDIYVYSILADDEGNIYAGGQLKEDSSENSSIIKKWDGEKWTDIKSVNGYEVTDAEFDKAGNLYFSVMDPFGEDPHMAYIYKIDASGTKQIGESVPGVISTLSFNSNNELYIGGSFNAEKYGTSADYIAKLSGEKWIPISSDQLEQRVFTITFDENDNLYAGGSFNKSGDVELNSLARWNGKEWQSFDDGLDGMVFSIVFDKNKDLIVGGYFLTAGDVVSPYAAKFVFSEEAEDDPNADSDSDSLESSDNSSTESPDENDEISSDGQDNVVHKEGDGCSCSFLQL